MPADQQVIGLLRGQLAAIVLGTVFTSVGAAACATAPFARAGSTRLLTWFGLFSGLYGLRILVDTPAVLTALLPHAGGALASDLDWVITYVILVPAALFFGEMSRGLLRQVLHAIAAAGAVLAVAGIATVLGGYPPATFILPNNALAIVAVLALVVVSVTPSLRARHLRFSSPVLTAGLLVNGAAVVYTNVSGLLPYRRLAIEPLAIAVFLTSLGYTTVRQVFRNERALLSISKELEIARGIQRSILPAAVPALRRLRIAAAYHPMTAVAGDFYEFIPLDAERAGFLIADVSGHGVPAALVASMVKVAVLSLTSRAADPAALLSELNRMFTRSLRSPLLTAGYLYLDPTQPRALYSAAGHPPLLYWSSAAGDLCSVESNGLLIGVVEEADYPVCTLEPRAGDRFLLYTDGLSEAENAAGEPFGERALPDLLRRLHDRTAEETSASIRQHLRHWHGSEQQQDDVSWLIVDVL